MNLLDGVRSALRMIRAHTLRAAFMVLGTVIGVTFLIAVVTLIQGMDTYMRDDFGGRVYGFNTVTVRQTPSVMMSPTPDERREWLRRPRLRFADADWIADRLETPGTVATSSSRMGTVLGPDGREVQNVRVTGASASYFDIRDLRLEEGRPFSEQEGRTGAAVLVLGRDVADLLFPDRSPLGREVRTRGATFRVVGVLEGQGTLFGMSMDNVAIGPARSRMNGTVSPPGVVQEIAVQVPHPELVASAMTEIEGLMRIRHRLRPTEANSFEVETSETALGFWDNIRTIMLVALPGLVGISLVVGGVVIMNIMLVSVTERTKEIGLRKSLGARRRDILLQFLIEAGVLSGAGGALGIALGIGLARLVATVSPLPAEVPAWAIGAGIALGVGVGVVAGVYPAWRASRLDPIDALRHE